MELNKLTHSLRMFPYGKKNYENVLGTCHTLDSWRWGRHGVNVRVTQRIGGPKGKLPPPIPRRWGRLLVVLRRVVTGLVRGERTLCPSARPSYLAKQPFGHPSSYLMTASLATPFILKTPFSFVLSYSLTRSLLIFLKNFLRPSFTNLKYNSPIMFGTDLSIEKTSLWFTDHFVLYKCVCWP